MVPGQLVNKTTPNSQLADTQINVQLHQRLAYIHTIHREKNAAYKNSETCYWKTLVIQHHTPESKATQNRYLH